MINIKTDPEIPEEFRAKNPEWWQEQMLNDLFFLCKVVLKHGKKTEYRDLNWLHRDLCDYISDKELLQILVLMFRDSLKSSIARALMIQWFLQKAKRNEEGKAFIYSGVYDLAEDHGDRIIKEIINNELIQAFFYSYIPHDRNEFDNIALDKGKIRFRGIEIDIGSIEKPLSGHHYELGVNDNLCNEKNTQTEESRNKVHYRWRAQEAILIEDAREIIFETTWHFQDVSGRILNEEGNFKYSKLKGKPCYKFVSETGYHVFSCPARDEEGRPVFPEKVDEAYLARKRKKMGSYLFSALYDLQPVADEDIIIRSGWLVHYDSLPENHIRNMMVDCAGTKERESSYSAISLGDWDERGKLHLSFAERKKLSPMELLDWIIKVKDHSEEKEGRKIFRIGIESEKFGISLRDSIRRFYHYLYEFILLIELRNVPRPVRFSSLIPHYECGDILSKKGLTDYENEVRTYFKGKKKGTDILDTVWQHFQVMTIPEKKKPVNLRYTPIEPVIPPDVIRAMEMRKKELAGSRSAISRMF